MPINQATNSPLLRSQSLLSHFSNSIVARPPSMRSCRTNSPNRRQFHPGPYRVECPWRRCNWALGHCLWPERFCCNCPPSDTVPVPVDVEWIHFCGWFPAATIPIRCGIRTPGSAIAKTVAAARAVGTSYPIHRFRYYDVELKYIGQRTKTKEECFGVELTCSRSSSTSTGPYTVRTLVCPL